MPRGVYRYVLAIGNMAIKVPRPRKMLSGMRCNRWEREMWHVWRKKFGWDTLCPIWLTDPCGFVMVMHRASQPVTAQEIEATPDYYPDITAEMKPDDWGRIGGRIVAADYAYPDADMVARRRAYYSVTKRR
jgi:hypothetical protein